MPRPLLGNVAPFSSAPPLTPRCRETNPLLPTPNVRPTSLACGIVAVGRPNRLLQPNRPRRSLDRRMAFLKRNANGRSAKSLRSLRIPLRYRLPQHSRLEPAADCLAHPFGSSALISQPRRLWNSLCCVCRQPNLLPLARPCRSRPIPSLVSKRLLTLQIPQSLATHPLQNHKSYGDFLDCFLAYSQSPP